MSEQGMRKRIVHALRPMDAVSVENPAYPGTPDINYIEGWLELKWLRNWPVGEETLVLIPHYTQQQRVWMFRRWMLGGRVHLLLQVKHEWLLFNGEKASRLVGKATKQELREQADKWWYEKLNEEDLRCYLTTTLSIKKTSSYSGVDAKV